MSKTLIPVPFFTDAITLIPHSLSSELGDKIEQPLTIGEFAKRTGAQRISLYATSDQELVVQGFAGSKRFFAEGPERFPTH